MKPIMMALAAVATLAVAAVSPRVASASETAHMTSAQPQDFSAAKRHHKHARVYRRYDGGYVRYHRRPYGYGNYGGYYAPPYSLYNYFKSQGRCVVDEGYGRATLCEAL
jgi:hypothetical protein